MTEQHTELLLLRDGRMIAHNLTPAMAALLRQFGLTNLTWRTCPCRKAKSSCKKARAARKP
jgi:hypothetical protein